MSERAVAEPEGADRPRQLSYLHALGVDSIIIAGTSTSTSVSGCVRSSSVDAFSFNYPTVVVEDCCFDRRLTSHAIALLDLHFRCADVVRLDELLPMVDGSGDAAGAATSGGATRS